MLSLSAAASIQQLRILLPLLVQEEAVAQLSTAQNTEETQTESVLLCRKYSFKLVHCDVTVEFAQRTVTTS